MPDTASPPGPAASNASLRAYLRGLPGVDEVGARERAGELAARSIKSAAKGGRSTSRSGWST